MLMTEGEASRVRTDTYRDGDISRVPVAVIEDLHRREAMLDEGLVI
jgi:hypothetical protein